MGTTGTEGVGGDGTMQLPFSQSFCGNRAFYVGLGLLSVAFWHCNLSKLVAARKRWEWTPGQAEGKTMSSEEGPQSLFSCDKMHMTERISPCDRRDSNLDS